MTKKKSPSSTVQAGFCFAKELAGENPPSFSTMQSLYKAAVDLFAIQPWRLIDESELVLVRHSESNEIAYCSVMGRLGEVFSLHAYIGAQSYRMFRRVASEENIEPGEFLASLRSVSVEYLGRAELNAQDRSLLASLDHPVGRGLASPIFRAIRPGFHPWFVTQEEATLLTECIRAVIVVCSAVSGNSDVKFWDKPETFPMVKQATQGAHSYGIEPLEAPMPPEPPVARAHLDEESLRSLRTQDFVIEGAIEADWVLTSSAIGERNQRKACTGIALAVDARSGMLYAPEMAKTAGGPADPLAKVCLGAIQGGRRIPAEIRVRSTKLKECLAPLSERLNIPISAARRLPELDKARSSLLRMLHGEEMY